MKKVLGLTLQDILDMNGEVDIYFHDLESKGAAKEVLEEFSDIGPIEEKSSENYMWLKIDDGSIDVTAFYDEKEYEPEEARARMTEYERGLRDSGHRQTDFL